MSWFSQFTYILYYTYNNHTSHTQFKSFTGRLDAGMRGVIGAFHMTGMIAFTLIVTSIVFNIDKSVPSDQAL